MDRCSFYILYKGLRQHLSVYYTSFVGYVRLPMLSSFGIKAPHSETLHTLCRLNSHSKTSRKTTRRVKSGNRKRYERMRAKFIWGRLLAMLIRRSTSDRPFEVMGRAEVSQYARRLPTRRRLIALFVRVRMSQRVKLFDECRRLNCCQVRYLSRPTCQRKNHLASD